MLYSCSIFCFTLSHSYANILILIPFSPPPLLAAFPSSSTVLISAFLLLPSPPSSFSSSSPPLLICELNYSILPGLLILLIEPITFWLDQCGKGNDLNGCSIKPHNRSSLRKREGRRREEGGKGRRRWKEQRKVV